MKVLHLPYNVASQISVSVQGLRAIGVEARGLIATSPSDVVQSHDHVELLPEPPALPRSFRWARQHARRHRTVMAAIAWADVLHWHFGALVLRRGFDLTWARVLRKPGLVEFWGDDIRIAELEAADNPTYAAHAPLDYRARQTPRHSLETQAPFAKAGFRCSVPDAAMLQYVRQDLFPKVHLVRQRVLPAHYAPRPPDPARTRPLVLHSPSDPRLKGTEFVLEAVERLRARHEFDFRLVHGLPRGEALALLGEADIFVDQLIFGAHGLAALEAMALAKPVVCYIKPSMVSQYPPDLPVVSANPDDITEVLATLLTDGRRRRDLGLRGRAYVEQHHDAAVVAGQLKGIYQDMLATRSRRARLES